MIDPRPTPAYLLGMKFPRFLIPLLAIAPAFPSLLSARTFTDDKGGTTEAELSAVSGEDVILRRNGVAIRWPIARLSAKDQSYVKKWQADPPSTPNLFVRLWPKKGFSPAGSFADEPSPQPSLPNIPGVLEVNKRDTYHYYDVDVSNPSATQANQLSLAYQLYVITAAGGTVVEVGTETLPPIAPGKVGSAATKAISSTRTKTKALSLQANGNGGVSTREKRSTSGERFGGGWVRVYAHDGSVVGESRQLIPEIEASDPAWVGPTVAETAKLEGLGQFDELIQQVKEQFQKIDTFLQALPPLPAPPIPEKEKPGLPPLPRFPGPPE